MKRQLEVCRYPEECVERIEYHVGRISVVPPILKCIGDKLSVHREKSARLEHREKFFELLSRRVKVLRHLAARNEIVRVWSKQIALREKMRIVGGAGCPTLAHKGFYREDWAAAVIKTARVRREKWNEWLDNF